MDDFLESEALSLADLMSMPAIVIGPEARTCEVLALAGQHAIHHFPIVDEGRLLGIVCVSDLQVAEPESPVIHQAWRHVVTATPPSSTEDAARMMRLYGVDSVVVADDDGVWGIVTREDLLDADPTLERWMSGS